MDITTDPTNTKKIIRDYSVCANTSGNLGEGHFPNKTRLTKSYTERNRKYLLSYILEKELNM